MTTFFKIYKNGFESLRLSENNSNKFFYEIEADTSSASISINSKKISISYSKGLNVYFLKDNKLDLYRTYSNPELNIPVLEDILTKYSEHIIVFIQNTPIESKQRVLYSNHGLTKYKVNTVDITIFNSKFKVFTHSVSMVKPYVSFIIDSIDDLGASGYSTIFQKQNVTNESFSINIDKPVCLKYKIKSGFIEYGVNTLVKHFESGSEVIDLGELKIKVSGELDYIIASYALTPKLNNASLGVNGVLAREFIEEDTILSLTDHNKSVSGSWYTNKVNGEWVLEYDNGEPIKNYFVFDDVYEERPDRVVKSNTISEISEIKLDLVYDNNYVDGEKIEYTRPYFEKDILERLRVGEVNIKTSVVTLSTSDESIKGFINEEVRAPGSPEFKTDYIVGDLRLKYTTFIASNDKSYEAEYGNEIKFHSEVIKRTGIDVIKLKNTSNKRVVTVPDLKPISTTKRDSLYDVTLKSARVLFKGE